MVIASIWQRAGPRLRLSSAVAWTVFIVVTLGATLGASLSAIRAEQQARVDSEGLLNQSAIQMARSLQTALATRRAIMEASAAQIVASSAHGDGSLLAPNVLEQHLSAIRRQFPEFVWLGVADGAGRLEASVGAPPAMARRLIQGGFESDRPRPAPRADPGTGISQPAGGDRPRVGDVEVIALTVPMRGVDGEPVGVLGSAMSWSWLQTLMQAFERDLGTDRAVQAWLLDGDDRVLVSPIGQPDSGPDASADRVAMLTGAHVAPMLGTDDLHWKVVLKERAGAVEAAGRATRNAVFVSTLLSGLLAAVLAAWAARRLLARLRRLSDQALAVQQGARHSLDPLDGHDEVAQIGNTLAGLVDDLSRERQALVRLNSELDARVAERTARIERLSEETRQAAVGRERLRMARELHDTLAHSLMALLTQVRLIRKLHRQMPPAELETELRSAESVAASGLDEARAAIRQMRHNSVRELGLGTALAELAARFGRRTGLKIDLDLDQTASAIAGERAETAFRIAEEALHNTERHGRAERLTILLSPIRGSSATDDPAAAPRLRLEISDDGAGFDPDIARPGHYGLHGMVEQANLMQAGLKIDSQPGQGTRIILEFVP